MANTPFYYLTTTHITTFLLTNITLLIPFSFHVNYSFFVFSFWLGRTNSIINQLHRLSFLICPALACVFNYF